jgi:methyl-accepting chemotaxis protein
MKQKSIGAKLFLVVAIPLVFMVLIGLTGYRSANTIYQSFSGQAASIDNLVETDRDLQQLLVSERSMILTDVQSKLFNELVEDYQENLAQAGRRFEKFKATATTAEQRKEIYEYEKARDVWLPLSLKALEGRKADTREGRRLAIDLSMGQAKVQFEKMRQHLDALTQLSLEMNQTAVTVAQNAHKNGKRLITAITLAGILLCILLAFYFVRGINRSLKIAIVGISESAGQVASASGQISAASQSLAEGASEQATAIEETSSSLEEMSSMTKQNADNAGQANSLMSEAKVVVDKAGVSMKEMNKSMDEISSAGQEIGKIIKTIDEISFQTNLLALNAAVEAARAGEAGAGFAVVADEVRNLAQRAADAAKNTANLIEGTITRINQGTDLVRTTDEDFKEVAVKTAKVAELISEIAAASSEQAQGIDQVNQAVSQMDKVTQTNAANAEESASASEELNAQAESMLEMVNGLAAIVGGAAAAAKAQAVHKTQRKPEPRRQALPRPEGRRRPEREPNARIVKSDEIIPMDDDFADF